MRSIKSLTLVTTAVASMPMDPSSEVGLTMSGKAMSWAWSMVPRQAVAKYGD